MKVFKILVLVLVLLVVVVVGGIAAFINFADPNDFKDLIADKVRTATGRELSLVGPLEIGVWPKIRIDAGALTLGNAPGFADEPMLAAEKIQIAVATLPLLRNRLEMDTVVIHGLDVKLARNAEGVTNFDDLTGDGEDKSDGSTLAAIVLGGVDIKDARVTWQDATTGQDVAISNINAQTGELTFGDPVAFSLALTAVANQPALDSDVKLTGTVAYDLADEHYVISPLALNAVLRGEQLPGGSANLDLGAVVDVNLKQETATISALEFTGLGTTVEGELAARDIEDEQPSVTGKLVVKGKDIAQIFNAFDMPVAKQLGQVSDRSFTFNTAFDADMDSGNVSVSEFAGKLLGATVDGSFDATKANTDTPSATGKLNASGPDLPSLLAIIGQLQGADAATLKSLNDALASAADKSFSINADLDANLAEGRADLPRLEAEILGNTITGQLRAVNAGSDKPAVTGNLKASGPDFPTLATVIAQLQGADAAALKSLNAALRSAADKSFSVSADIDADLAKGTANLPKLDARLLGNTVTGQIAASGIDGDKPAAKGTLTARGTDLPAMLAIASQFQTDGKGLRDLAKGLAKEKDRAFDIQIAFDTDMKTGRIDLPQLSADLLGLEIRGGLKGEGVDFEKSQGKLDGKLSVSSKDLGPLLRSADQADLAQSLKTLNLDLGIKGSLSDLTFAPFTATALVANPEVPKPVELKISAGTARANLDKDTLSLQNVTVTGLGLNAKADIEASGISQEPRYSGTLNVPAFNLRTLLKSLNKPVPKTADPKALTSIGLTSKLAGSAGNVKLDDLTIKLDDTTIKGNINILDFTGPHLAFGIGIDKLDADRYLEPAKKGKTRAATPEAAAAGAASEIPVETLRALQIKGDLLIGNLVLSGAKMKNVKFSINAKGGKIKLAPLGAELYEGAYNGVIGLDATGKRAKLDLKTGLKNVNVEPLLKDTVDSDLLAGIVSFDAALKGIGGDSEQLKRTLTGSGRFDTRNGIFRGVDAIAVLRAVEQIIECKCPVPVPKGGETRFSSLGGTINAKNGVLRNEDLVLAGDGFTIRGEGMLANLHDNSVKYDLELAVTEARKEATGGRYNLGGYKVPIACRGKLDKPSCLPDVGQIVSQVVKAEAKKKVEKAVGKKLKDAVGGEAGEALKNILKF